MLSKSVKNLRSFFISQCKNGNWRESYNGFKSEYFEVQHDVNNDKKGWWISFNSSSFKPSEIGITRFHFFILTLYIKISAKNSAERNRHSQIERLSNDFFSKNKHLLRDSKLDEILN